MQKEPGRLYVRDTQGTVGKMLFEDGAPDPGEWYSNFGIYLAEYHMHGDGQHCDLMVYAEAEMARECTDLRLECCLYFDNLKYKCPLHSEELGRGSFLTCIGGGAFQKSEQMVLETMDAGAELTWTDGDGTHKVMHISEKLTVNMRDYLKEYRHAWPKKRRRRLNFTRREP